MVYTNPFRAEKKSDISQKLADKYSSPTMVLFDAFSLFVYKKRTEE